MNFCFVLIAVTYDLLVINEGGQRRELRGRGGGAAEDPGDRREEAGPICGILTLTISEPVRSCDFILHVVLMTTSNLLFPARGSTEQSAHHPRYAREKTKQETEETRSFCTW